ncbi:unnamed protein product [Lymnaea stagnalis]|uniref:DNA polymerase delta subunit 3 n=1 Tax=Lymnaea stagnalis TaxID=6523 RepID=A0AAV2H765_LYMST
MATNSEDTLIQENIEEYINDDNKIVTCRWLSLMLNLNINDAKRALNTFVKHHRNKPADGLFNVTYFIAGLGKSKDGEPMHKCVVVPEAHLEEVKNSLSIVTSCHIYSVQRAKLKDYTSLYLTDYDIIKNNLEKCQLLSSIKCPRATLRQQSKPSVKSEGSSSEIKFEKDEQMAVISSKSATSSSAKGVSKKAEPKGSIANMFASAGKKDKGDEKTSPVSAKVNEPTEPSTKAKVKSKPTEKKGGVLSLFSKQEVKNAENAETNKEKASEKERSKASATKSNTSSTKSNPPKTSQTKEKKNMKKRTKDSGDEDEEILERKHRRRIRTDLFDSSDEEEYVSDVEEEMEMSPVAAGDASDEEDTMGEKGDEEKQVKESVVTEDVKEKENITTNSANAGGCRKRKRTQKVASKTFVDEDGFIVTTKVTEWESESDDEVMEVQEQKPVIAPTKKNSVAQKAEPKGKAPSKKAAVSPQKGKQTSLMAFFKKK